VTVTVPAPLDVLVVGAGVTGLYQLYRAREAGFSVHLVEAGTGVGGTWFWNRYPGARFDSESYTYGYLFSEELFDEWAWSEHFAGQPEIERYLDHVADRFDLRRHIRLGARVVAAAFDEADGTWAVSLDDGDGIRARHVVAATGVLSVPVFPDVPGRADFAGVQHHTGLWPAEPVDLTRRRVAVVGTGSSGVQVVPAIADRVAALTVYQRTAHWCTPLNNRPITAAEQAALRADFARIRETLNTSASGFLHLPHDRTTFEDTPEQRQAFYERMWASPGFAKLISHYPDVLLDEAANAEWCAFLAEKVRGIVHDPATAERLIPHDHAYGEHRPPFVTGYYETYNRPNVELVDLRATPMVRVTAAGIETTDATREHDVIVWATGFDFGTGALARMGIRGRGGVALTDHWADGPRTFLGLATSGFPNLWFPGGPHAAAGNNPRYNGDQVDAVTAILVRARERGAAVVDTDPAAEATWTDMVDRGAGRRPSFGAGSYYFGANVAGKPRRYLLNSAGRPKLFRELQKLVDTDYAAFPMGAAGARASGSDGGDRGDG